MRESMPAETSVGEESRKTIGRSDPAGAPKGTSSSTDSSPSQPAASEPEASEAHDYNRSIHASPDARAWAKFFMDTWSKMLSGGRNPFAIGANFFSTEEWMGTWFANAMMAMHDHLKPKEQAAINAATAELREEWKNLSVTAIAADNQNVLAYITQVENERDQLREECARLKLEVGETRLLVKQSDDACHKASRERDAALANLAEIKKLCK